MNGSWSTSIVRGAAGWWAFSLLVRFEAQADRCCGAVGTGSNETACPPSAFNRPRHETSAFIRCIS